MNDFLQSLRNGQSEKQRTPKTRKNTDNSYHYTSPNRFHSYSNGYQNTRNQNLKRQSIHQQQTGNQRPMDDSSATALLSEAIENLSSHIETLAKNQDYLVNAQERTADMLERQAIAIERIVDHLKIAPGPDPASPKKENLEKTFKNHYVTTPKSQAESSKAPERPVEKIKPARQATKSPVKTPEKQVVRKRKKVLLKKAEKTVKSDKKLLGRDAVMDIIHTMRAKGATFDQVATRLISMGQPTFSGRGEWHAQTIHRLCNKK